MILHRLSSVLICSTLVSIATGAPAPLHPRDSLRRRAASAVAPVDLGSAINYVILAQAEITTVPTSHIVGDIGASPESHTAITGFSLVLDSSGSFATSSQVSGKVWAADYSSPTPSTLTQAINDANAAYGRAALETPADFIELGGGAIGGLTLTPGIYKWSTGVVIGADITLTGPCDAVFVFQISGILTQAALSQVNLVGGVLASRIYWQTTGGVTIGQGATFEGIILSASDVLLNTGSSMTGRIFSTKIASLYRPQPYDPAWCAIITVTEVLPGSTATVAGAVVTLPPVTNVFTTTAAGAIETDWLTLWQTSTSISYVPTVTTITIPTTLVVLETMTAAGAAAAAVTLTATQVSTWTTMVAGPAVTQVVTSTETVHDTVVSTIVQPATTFVTTLSGPVVTSLSTIFANGVTTVVTGIVSTMTWTEVSTVTMPAATDLTTLFVPIQRVVLQTITAPAVIETLWMTTTMVVKETVIPTAAVGAVNTVSVPTTLISVVSTQVPVATSIVTFLSTGPALQPTPTTPPAGTVVGGPASTPIATNAGENTAGPILPIPSPTVVAGGGTPEITPSNGQVTAVDIGNQVPPVASAPASASPSVGGGGAGTGTDTGGGNNGNGGGNNDNNNNQNGNIVTTTMFVNVPTTIYASSTTIYPTPVTVYMTPTTVYASSTTVTSTVASITITTGFPVFPFYPTSIPSIPSSETDVVNSFTFPSYPSTTVSTVGAECTASVAQAAYSAAASAAYLAGVAAASSAASVAASVCPNPEPTAGLDGSTPVAVNFQQKSSATSTGGSWGLVISAISFLVLYI